MPQEQPFEPYADPDRPGVVRVPVVSNKHKGMEAIVDAADLPLVQGRRWNWSGGHAGGTGASVVVPKYGSLPRIILGLTDPALQVKYLNGDRLDCRRGNLAVQTRSEVAKARKGPKKWEMLEPYPDADRPGVVRVPVCSGKHKGMEALIDAADLPVVQGNRWNWSPGQPDPAKDGSVIIAMVGTPKPSLARILLGISDPAQRVCHLNGDRLDCRRENLVVRTIAESARYRRKLESRGGRVCSSAFKGVSWKEGDHRWQAGIAVDGKKLPLGCFKTEIAAAHAYDQAARQMFGQHARLNFPDGIDPAVLAEAMATENYQPPYPPPGTMDRQAACRMFGISYETWQDWENKGRVPTGQWVNAPDGKAGRCKVYPIDELNRLLEEFNNIGKPYADPDRPGCIRVPIRSFTHRMEAIIDEADLPLMEGRNWNWSPREEGKCAGQVILSTVAPPQTPLSRIIAGVSGYHERVQHLNDDPLDCRRANLIVRTCAEQVHANRKMRTQHGRPCTSKFKGVCWDMRREKWIAQIRKDGRGRHIGRFGDELAAAEAYDEAARELFGEHAYLNFPDGVDAWLAKQAAGCEAEDAAEQQREAA